jgi:integrase/recombinase XerD
MSKAIPGFIQYKEAEGISKSSIIGYKHDLKLWLEHMGDTPVDKVTAKDIQAHLAWLRTEYEPRRYSGKIHPLSPKTIRNVWMTLSSFFSWASVEFDIPKPMKGVPIPRCKKSPVDVFTKEDIEALLKACDYCRESNPWDRRKFTMKRSTAKRDRAIILTLFDTGLRASELCALKIGDVDFKTGKVQVKHGVLGGAKGGKGRVVFIGKATRRSVWRYLVDREDGEDENAPLFLGKHYRPLNPNSLRHVIVELGERAEVKNCYPHRFRHTFAITYLRSGGDVFTLQALLGHSSLDMVRHYAQIAEIDIAAAHHKASPADNWRL